MHRACPGPKSVPVITSDARSRVIEPGVCGGTGLVRDIRGGLQGANTVIKATRGLLEMCCQHIRGRCCAQALPLPLDGRMIATVMETPTGSGLGPSTSLCGARSSEHPMPMMTRNKHKEENSVCIRNARVRPRTMRASRHRRMP